MGVFEDSFGLVSKAFAKMNEKLQSPFCRAHGAAQVRSLKNDSGKPLSTSFSDCFLLLSYISLKKCVFSPQCLVDPACGCSPPDVSHLENLFRRPLRSPTAFNRVTEF